MFPLSGLICRVCVFAFVFVAAQAELDVEPRVLLAPQLRHMGRVEVELRVEHDELTALAPEGEVVLAKLALVVCDRLHCRLVCNANASKLCHKITTYREYINRKREKKQNGNIVSV